MGNWIKTSDKIPNEAGRYLVAWRLNKDYQFVYSLAYWEPDIANSYPFMYDSNYKGRTGGGWVCTSSEDDYELTNVECWMKIPLLPIEN